MHTDYDHLGVGYARNRQPDPRLAHRVHAAVGSGSSLVNIGAGAGSYEPDDRFVIAVEPARTMLLQRPLGSAPAVLAVAERLPLADRSVDAAMAIFTLHHWSDFEAGLREMKRVARNRLVLVTIDPDVLAGYWFVKSYAPEIMDAHGGALPSLEQMRVSLPNAEVSTSDVPADCSDLFFLALWARPELYLDARLRAATSVWRQLPTDVVARSIVCLRRDLESGRWDDRHGDLRTKAVHDVGVRIITVDLDTDR